jgi:hypothetical protein
MMTISEWTAKELEEIAARMRAGTYSETTAMVLLTRDKATGIMTINVWGKDVDVATKLIREAYQAKCVGVIEAVQ